MLHKHHRKRRSQGGDDSPVNVIEIPDWLHDKVHAEPEWAYENGLLVKSHEEPEEVQITLPEKVFVAKKKKAEKTEEKRARAVWSIKIPLDVRENGAEILDALMESCKDALDNVLGLDNDVPAYYVLVPVLHDWLQDNSDSPFATVPTRKGEDDPLIEAAQELGIDLEGE